MKVVLLFMQFVVFKVVFGSIECHYCGFNNLCPLPYNGDKLYDGVLGATENRRTDRVFCSKSCMKFDGKSLMDDRRVLVRTCGVEDINRCDKNVTYLGARGTFCVCNGINCNSGIQLKFCCICFALIILLHFLTH